MNEDDPELLRRMLRGDRGALAALYRRRQSSIYRFALHMTGSVPAAEDVTQETFLELLGSAGRYDPERGTVAAFLYGIARNLILRRWGGARETELGCEDFAGLDDPLADLTRREAIEQVRRAVVSLPAPYREALALCDLGDASYEEAAAALDCPVGTVRSRLNRARALLARKLAPARGLCDV